MTESPAGSRGLVACVVDAPPKFHLQALCWFATLTRCAGVAARDLAVFDAGGGPESDVLAYLKAQGVRVQRIAPFDARSPHCNKIAALAAAATDAAGTIAFTDCDFAFLADPRTLLADTGALHAKPVTKPRPSFAVLERVLAARGLPVGETQPLQIHPAEKTCVGNANGGLYVGAAPLMRELAKAWAREALWLLDERALLERWAVNVDQVSMLLTLRVGGFPFRALHLGANLQTSHRVAAKLPPAEIGPLLGLHYQKYVTSDGFLKPHGAPYVDAGIEKANVALREQYREFFPKAA